MFLFLILPFLQRFCCFYCWRQTSNKKDFFQYVFAQFLSWEYLILIFCMYPEGVMVFKDMDRWVSLPEGASRKVQTLFTCLFIFYIYKFIYIIFYIYCLVLDVLLVSFPHYKYHIVLPIQLQITLQDGWTLKFTEV